MSNELKQQRRTAEIAGGGIAGLVAAIALAQRGWTATVHERAPVMRFHGSGIALGNIAQFALNAIHAREDMTEGQLPLHRREMRNAQGKLIGHVDWPYEICFIGRGLLLERLLRIAAELGVVIKTGSEIVSVDPQGHAELSDGTRVFADLVVVADGAKSELRRKVAPQAHRETLKYGAARALAPRSSSDVDIPSYAWADYWAGKRRLYFGPMSGDSVYLAFACSRDDVADGSPQREGEDLIDVDLVSWKRSFPLLAPVLDRMTEAPKWSPFQQVSASSWVNGRVVMIGDAAHAMTPSIGAGAATAMMDAVTLAIALENAVDLPLALKRWEADYRAPVDRLQRASRFWSDTNGWPTLLQRALMKLTPHSRRLMASRVETVPGSVAALTSGRSDFLTLARI